MVFEVTLGVKALAAVQKTREVFLTSMNTHMHFIVLAHAENFSTLGKGTLEWFRPIVQVHMLFKTSLSGEFFIAVSKLTLEL